MIGHIQGRESEEGGSLRMTIYGADGVMMMGDACLSDLVAVMMMPTFMLVSFDRIGFETNKTYDAINSSAIYWKTYSVLIVNNNKHNKTVVIRLIISKKNIFIK